MAGKNKNPIKVIAVVGPTASGKSALAVLLARHFDGEVISADSRQVYRGLDIGTEKITKREMHGVPHHLIDVASPRHPYSAARFKRDAERAIRDIVQRGKVPIVAGGTGFYFDVLLDNARVAPVPPNPLLRKKLGKKTTVKLFDMLSRLDPARAETIDRHNRRRLIRAIEVAKASSQKKSPRRTSMPPYDVLWIGLDVPRDELKRRIAVRLRKTLRKGLVAEIKRLRAEGISWKRIDELGLEYRIVGRYVRSELSKEEMEKGLLIELWHYAKRQMTWFRRNKNIAWYMPKNTRQIERAVKNFLKA